MSIDKKITTPSGQLKKQHEMYRMEFQRGEAYALNNIQDLSHLDSRPIGELEGYIFTIDTREVFSHKPIEYNSKLYNRVVTEIDHRKDRQRKNPKRLQNSI